MARTRAQSPKSEVQGRCQPHARLLDLLVDDRLRPRNVFLRDHGRITDRGDIPINNVARVAIAVGVLAWITFHGSAMAFADVVAEVRRTHSMAADKVEYAYAGDKPEKKRTGVVYLKGPRVRTEFAGGDRLVNIGDRSTGEFLAFNTVGRSAWRALRRDRVSIMPEGLDGALTPEEFRDLLAFLQSLK